MVRHLFTNSAEYVPRCGLPQTKQFPGKNPKSVSFCVLNSCMLLKFLQTIITLLVESRLALTVLFTSLPELHSQVWSRLCKAGTTGTEQREDTAEDGGVRLD